MTASEGREIGNRSQVITLLPLESSPDHRSQDWKDTRNIPLGERDATGWDVEDQEFVTIWHGGWRCLVLIIKISIRQALPLSAMRIKFVGSVNNKKQSAPNIEYQEICSGWLADEKRVKTRAGKLLLANIKTCLHKPRPLPRYNLHSRHCIPVWPELPGPGLPSSSRRYVLIVWYANVKIQTQRERDWLVFSHGSLRSLIEVSANIILELSASQEIRQLAAWARHPRFTIEVKFWLKGRTEDCVRDRNNKSSVLWGCKNYCEINQPLRDYSGNNKEQELGMINEYRDCNQYFFIFKWTQWVPRAEETTEDIYVHVSKWTMSGPGYWDSPEGIITTLNTQTLGDHPAPRHTAQWL